MRRIVEPRSFIGPKEDTCVKQLSDSPILSGLIIGWLWRNYPTLLKGLMRRSILHLGVGFLPMQRCGRKSWPPRGDPWTVCSALTNDGFRPG
jgi:hypothetical protein